MEMNFTKFALYSKTLGNSRHIRVYYPRHQNKRCPVLYVHDGEFCFRADTPDGYECLSLDLALEQIGKEMIIVSLEAMSWQIRTREYSPFHWIGDAEKYLPKGEEQGDVYLEWVIKEVKPYIDEHFWTKPDCEHTFMMGCSLGALISLYAGAKYPDTFSKIGSFSLASWGNHQALLAFLDKNPYEKTKLFMRVGTEEGIPRDLVNLGNCYVGLNREVYEHLKALGTTNINFKINEGTRHKTSAWEKDMPEFLTWLAKKK